ncbi:hypothetical protein ACRQ5Q_24480 [Bradyrhizobium sp. PMVTL-01]|uniref:hypothetical protein n=1 Tax=Bradyrhizobium sp. PMVTL-01 TaxID=3434999 RepID=UPI003F705725
MSSREREKEKREAWARKQEAAERERNRRANLSMYSRIEEFVEDEELRNILHAICQHIGMQDY